MSNGVGKLLEMPQAARLVDLLDDFHDIWFKLHQRRHEKAEREELESLAQDLLEAHTSILHYKNRHKKDH